MDVQTSNMAGPTNGEDITLDTEKPGEILTRIELDLACFSEKLMNLNVLVMHVAMRESDFEAFVSDNSHDLGDSASKALEFDFLSGVLDLEIRELDSFLSDVQLEINDMREFVYTYKHLGQFLEGIEDKINDSEESLKQSMDQVSEIKAQSAMFQRIVSGCSGEEKGDHGADIGENGDFFDLNEKVKMQTAEQQRHFLRMLEKSLARELDLEKKVGELKQIDKETKSKLESTKEAAFFMEQEAFSTWQRLLEAENTCEILMGTSKETLTRLNDYAKHEENLESELEDLKESTFKAKGECTLLREINVKLNEELAILGAKSDANEEKQILLYDTINDMEIIIEDLKSRVSRAEAQSEGVEENCIKLCKTNSELNEEISFLRRKLEKLEGSLRKSEETKIATAKDIGIRTKVITDLVVQLAFERERLHQQISLLKRENKQLSHQTVKDPLDEEESKDQSDVSTTIFEMEKMANNREATLETVRNIDPRQINYKYAVIAALALAFSVLAGVWVNQKQG